MSELTNIHARAVKDLTTPTELPVDLDALDQVKLVAGNFPAEYAGNEAMTVGVIKELAAQGREAELEEVFQKITQEETRAIEAENLLNQNKAEKTYVDSELEAQKTYVDSELEAQNTKVNNHLVDQTQTVNTALSQLSTAANKFYPTLAEANADIANITINQPVTIGESANEGLWYKATAGATSLTKSPHDPLTQAKADATTKANAAEANAKAYVDSNDGATRYDQSAFKNAPGYLSSNTQSSSLPGWRATDLIPVKAGDKVKITTLIAASGYPWLLIYNASQVFQSALNVTNTISTHQVFEHTFTQDGFFRTQHSTNGTTGCSIVVNEGKARFLLAGGLGDGTVKKSNIEGFIPSDNMFDPSTASLTTYVNNATGAFSSNASFPNIIRSDFIRVSASTEYQMSYIDVTSLYAEYDASKAFIRGGTGRGSDRFTTSETTAFVIVNLNKTLLNDYIFSKVGATTNYFDTFLWLEKRLFKLNGDVDEKFKNLPLSNNDSRFVGKNVLVTGDSITDSRNTHTTKWWHGFLKDWLKIGTIQNDGTSGSGLIKTGDQGVGLNYRLATWATTYTAPDSILIMGNMNDGTSGATGAWNWIYGESDAHKGDFTTVVDTTNMASSLWYALRYLFEELLRQYPNKPIGYIISQPRGQTATKSGTVRAGYSTKCWGQDGWFSEWSDVIEKVAAHYSIPVLNLYKESGMRPWIDANNTEFFSNGDRIHPNLKGHELMAQKIYEFVKQHC